MVFRPRGGRFIPSFQILLMLSGLWLAACGSDEQPGQASPTIQLFEITPEHLEAAGEVTIQWKTKGAATLELRQGDLTIDLGERNPAQDSIVVEVAESSTFTLEARDPAGRSTSKIRDVTVDAPRGPAIGELDAPELVEVNHEGEAAARISWAGVERAETLSLLAEGRDPIALDHEAAAGSIDVTLTEETTFTLVAANEFDEVSLQTTIRVAYLPVIETFDAERLLVGFGETTVVHWTTSGAAYVELWMDGEQLEANGSPKDSREVTLTFSSTLELRAVNEAGTTEIATLEIDVGPPSVQLFQYSSQTLWLGESASFNWQSTGGSSLDIHLDPSGELLCEVEDYGEIAESGCDWNPAEVGIYSVVLTVSNFSGVASSTVEIYVGDGPLITHFSAGPEVLTAEDPLEISWAVRPDPAGNVPSISLQDDRGRVYEAVDAEGRLLTSLIEPGPYELRLEASTDYPGSSLNVATANVFVHPRPAVDFVASTEVFDDSIHEEVVISWTTTDAETLSLYQIVDEVPVLLLEALGADREAGSHSFIPLEPQRYRLIAANTIGGQTVRDLSIDLAPTQVISVIADPPSFTQGQPITLSWATRMADEVSIDIGTKDYILEETTAPYLDLVDHGGTHVPLTAECGDVALNGCVEIRFPDEFGFPFGTDHYNRVWVYTVGYLGFSHGSRQDSVPTNTAIPTTVQNAGISLAPYWDSLGWDPARYPEGNIHTALLEEEGARIFVIQWRDIGYSPSTQRKASINFEVVLREDGSFDFRYGVQSARDTNLSTNVLNGSSATMGFQLPDQSDHGQLSFNGNGALNGLRDHRTFSYRPAPAFPLNGELVIRPLGPQTNFPITVTATRNGVSHSRSVDLVVSRRPILELTNETIPPVPKDEEFRIGWKSYNADSIVVLDENEVVRCTETNRERIDDGLCALSEPIGGKYTYTVRANGAHGTFADRIVSVDVFGAFGVASFTGPASADKGSDVLLRWITYETVSVSLLADGVEIYTDSSGALYGSFLVPNLQLATEFKLVATNNVGVEDEAVLMVGLWDITFGLQSTNTVVRPGDPITVTLDAKVLEGGAPVDVYGILPIGELTEAADKFSDIENHPNVRDLQISPTLTSTVTEVELPPDFVFPYMGVEYTKLFAFVDGYISFSHPAPAVYANNLRFPTTLSNSVHAHIAPFWDNLIPRNIGKMFTARTSDDTFTIQWSRMSFDNASSSNANPQNLNFQLVLHRSGSFDFRYGKMDPHPTFRGTSGCFPNDCTNEVAGSAATIGYQQINGGSGHNLHFGGSAPAAANEAVLGGLADRSFRYTVVQGSGSFTFHPNWSEVFTLCVSTATEPLCRELDVQAEFGVSSAVLSKEKVGSGESITLSWKTIGGKSLRILDGDQELHSTSDLAEVDAGSIVLHPTRNTAYDLELIAGGRREVVRRLVEVDRFSITSSMTQSSGPETPITVSWNLSNAGSGEGFHVTAPMEEISNNDWGSLDISEHPDKIQLIGANASTNTARLDFVDFTFPYFGVEHDYIQVSVDGYLFWGTTTSASNSALPTLRFDVALAPFWEDLHSRVNGRVFAKRLDNDRYVIQWSKMSLSSGSSNTNEGDLNFLVVLHRDGSFEYRFGMMLPPPSPAGNVNHCMPLSCERETQGSSATIGYQLPDHGIGHQIHFGGTNRGLDQPIVARINYRAWKFSPRSGSVTGSAEVRPTASTVYKLCAIEASTAEVICAPSLLADIPWGIDLFQSNPVAPLAGEEVTLSWSVRNLDSLRLLADGAELVAYTKPNIPALGSYSHKPSVTTTYTLEAKSLDRVVQEERVVALRTFDLEVTGPSGIFPPGETVVVDWELTKHTAHDVVMISPMSEIQLGEGGEGGFVDISVLTGAEELTLQGSTPANGHANVSLPFTFPYLGTQQNSLQVYVDGYVSFEGAGGNANGSNTLLPTIDSSSGNRVHLAVFWDDMILRGGDSLWSYSPDPNTLIVQWKNFSRVDGSSGSIRYDLNFQVVLRADGSFDYRYGTMAPPPPPFSSPACRPETCANEVNGSSATIGYQTTDAQYGSTLHIGSLFDSSMGGLSAEVDGSSSGDGFLAFPGGLSNRAFRYSPSPSGSARIVVGRTGEQEVCGIVGELVECKAVRIEAMASSGELMITEVMIDPAADVPGQWLEVRNLSSRTIDLQGFELRSAQGSHKILGPLPVPASGFVTLASSTQVPFTPDYVYDGEVPLNRLIDSLDLLAGQATISTVAWGIDWVVPRNQVLSLDPSLHLTGIQENPDFSSWCHTGPQGSPGSLGDGCLNSWYDVDPSSDRPFIDIASSGTRLYEIEGDNLMTRLPPTGFEVKLFGESFSRLWISSRGWISLHDFAPTVNPPPNVPSFPRNATSVTALQGPLIGAFWSSLSCGVGCHILYERREVSGQDVLIIQWEDFHISTHLEVAMTFQVQFWANGALVMAYGGLNNTYKLGTRAWTSYEGGDSWIGLEARDPALFLQVHDSRPLGFDRRSIHYRLK